MHLFIFSVSGVTDEVVEVVAEVVETVENVRLFMVATVTDVILTVDSIRIFIVATITFLVNLVVEILQFIIGQFREKKNAKCVSLTYSRTWLSGGGKRMFCRWSQSGVLLPWSPVSTYRWSCLPGYCRYSIQNLSLSLCYNDVHRSVRKSNETKRGGWIN